MSKCLDIVKEVTEQVTGKKVTGTGGFTQTETEIHGVHWMEILHELCHWLTATKEERLHPNLTFVSRENKEEEEATDQNYKQEIRASILNKHFNDIFSTEMTEQEIAYNEYVADAHGRMNLNYTEEELEKITNIDDLLKSSEVLNAINLLESKYKCID